MRKLLLLFSILLMISVQLRAQNEFLEPIETFGETTIIAKYHQLLFPFLYKGLSKKPLARFTEIPSFGPESTLSLEVDSVNNFYLIYRKLSESLWYNKLFPDDEPQDSLFVKEYKTQISQDFGFLFQNLYTALTYDIHKADKIDWGVDGTQYLFSTTNFVGDILTGTKTTYTYGESIKQVVKINEELIKAVIKNSIDYQDYDERIRGVIEDFEN